MQAPRTTTQLEVATGTNATKTKIDEEEQKQRAFRQSPKYFSLFLVHSFLPFQPLPKGNHDSLYEMAGISKLSEGGPE